MKKAELVQRSLFFQYAANVNYGFEMDDEHCLWTSDKNQQLATNYF